jgi:putative DNA primase/helicase
MNTIFALAKQGLTFAPTTLGMTRSDRKGWHEIATSDWDTITDWHREGLGLVSVAKHGKGFAIDIDNIAAVEAKGFRLDWLSGYYLVDTPSGGLHAHGLHDDQTDALGNLVVVREEKDSGESDKILELKLHNGSVAAPTARRINQPKKKDGIYQPRESSVGDLKRGLPPEFTAWLKGHADSQSKTVEGPRNWEFHDHWSLEDFLASNHCVEARQYWGDASTLYVIPDKCPLCDRAALASDTDLATKTKFIFGGRGWGFVCHACGVRKRTEFDSQMGDKFSDWKPWRKNIYCARQDDDEDAWEIEDAVVEEDEVVQPEPEKAVKKSESVELTPDEWDYIKQRYSEDTWQGLKVKSLRLLLPSISEDADEDSADALLEDTNKILGEYTNPEGTTSSLLTRRASDYEMVELKWLWPQKIPLGKATLFTGMPDCCKSLCLLDLCARVTTGRNFPDGELNIHGAAEVLIAATEDDPQDTIVPRLFAAGADLSKVHILKGILKKPKDKKRSKKVERLSLKRDIELLMDTMTANPNVKLLVLDPITGFFGDADANKDSDVRPMLEKLQRMLNASGVTLVGIIHSNKRSDVDAIGKVSGAGAIAAVVRATWGFSRDKEDKTLYHMAFVKGNLGKVKSGLDYSVDESTVEIQGKAVGVPRVVWGAVNDRDANELLDEARERKDEKDTKLIKATTLIQTMIPAKLKDIYAKGEEEGISEVTVKRAKQKIVGLVHKQSNKEWWVYLPSNPPAWTKPDTSPTMPDFECL